VAACVAIIPARWASSRFPGKPLAPLQGKPMLQHVVERVQSAAVFDEVRVATDDDRIAALPLPETVRIVRTRADHATGTDRVAEAAAGLPEDALVVNVQGDEPLVSPALLAELVQVLRDTPDAALATAAHLETDPEAFASPHVVKVVRDGHGRALYFSRAPIPALRTGSVSFLRHVGVYAFRQATLQRFVRLPVGDLEAREGLEQLRALENGIPIHVHLTPHRSVGVDTPEDLQAVERILSTTSRSLQPTRRG